MMKMFRILALSFLFCATSLKATDDDMPIIAYKGVPYWQTSEENFRIFRECGFTISLDSYPSIESMVKACRCANKYGIKILGRCPEITSRPTLMANTLKNENGFFGYMMQDEPSVPEIIERQKEIERLITVDSSHVFYINLLSYQRQDWFEKSTQAKTFTEYLKALSATSCHILGTPPTGFPPDAWGRVRRSTSCLLVSAVGSRDGRRGDQGISALAASPPVCIGSCTSRLPARRPFCRASPSPPFAESGEREDPADARPARLMLYFAEYTIPEIQGGHLWTKLDILGGFHILIGFSGRTT